MPNALDILKELEDIGAVGTKVQQPIVRRQAVAPILDPVIEEVAAEVVAAVIQAPEPNEMLEGFAGQLDVLESALRGMLRWCSEARIRLEPTDLEEEDSETEPEESEPSVETKAEDTELPVEPIEEIVTPVDPNDPVQLASPGVPVLAPHKKSLAELKAEFMLPDALTFSRDNRRPVTPTKPERSDG